MDAGGMLDRQDLRLDLPAALMEPDLGFGSEVEHRNRDPDRLARRADPQGGLADDRRIVDRPDDRKIAHSREHAVDFGVQLPRDLFAVSREQMLPFRRGNAIAVENLVVIPGELPSQRGAL